MAMSKDLLIATVVLVVCVGLLTIALLPSGSAPDGDDDSLARGDLATDRDRTPVREVRTSPPGRQTTEPESIRQRSDPPSRPVDPEPILDISTRLPPPDPDPDPLRLEDDAIDDLLAIGRPPLDEPDDDPLALLDDPPVEEDPPSTTRRSSTQRTTRDDDLLVLDDDPPLRRQDRVEAADERWHVVERGDVLGAISQQYYGTVAHWGLIRDANNVDPMGLRPGMRLRIPALPTTAAARADERVRRGDGRTHVVQRGESYWVIARDVLGDATRHRELTDLNDIGPYDLKPGDVITLPPPGPARASSTRAGSAATAIPSGARVHVVEAGDILGDISRRYYGTATRWREIAQANNISDPGRLRIGQRLVIPDAQDGPRATPRSTSADGRHHVVARGETLGEISMQYYGTSQRWREIQDANPGINPLAVPVGHRLLIPGLGDADGAARPSPSRSQPRQSDPPRATRSSRPPAHHDLLDLD